MTIKYILETIFGSDLEFHCENLDNKAMIEFNAASPFEPFAEPIIEVKEFTVDKMYLDTRRDYKSNKIKVVCLVNSSKECDQDKWMSVREVIEKLKIFDEDLEVFNIDKEYEEGDFFDLIINVYDEVDDDDDWLDDEDECEKKNVPDGFSGNVTLFII